MNSDNFVVIPKSGPNSSDDSRGIHYVFSNLAAAVNMELVKSNRRWTLVG